MKHLKNTTSGSSPGRDLWDLQFSCPRSRTTNKRFLSATNLVEHGSLSNALQLEREAISSGFFILLDPPSYLSPAVGTSSQDILDNIRDRKVRVQHRRSPWYLHRRRSDPIFASPSQPAMRPRQKTLAARSFHFGHSRCRCLRRMGRALQRRTPHCTELQLSPTARH